MTAPSTLLSYHLGDATEPVGDGRKIVAHICNDIGAWGRGFVLSVSRRWPEPERRYRQWWRERANSTLPLGTVQIVEVGEQLWVANMIAQRDIRTTNGDPPIRYDALSQCLASVRKFAYPDISVHMPRIGTGLAGGDWATIRKIIITNVCAYGVPVTVYDLPSPASSTRRNA